MDYNTLLYQRHLGHMAKRYSPSALERTRLPQRHPLHTGCLHPPQGNTSNSDNLRLQVIHVVF